MRLSNILKRFKTKECDFKPIVREMTYIGETKLNSGIFVIQQSTIQGVKNFCISVAIDKRMMIFDELRRLKSSDVYLYLKSGLLIEPFIEDDFEKVLEVCRMKLPDAIINEYSIFML